jgi:uncharacterized membrane protein YhhN
MYPKLAIISRNIFFVIAVFECLSHLYFLPFSIVSYFTKPMLIPALALYFFAKTKNTPKVKARNLFIMALLFGWFGDISLMLIAQNQLYFLIGLGSFLVMQLLYTYLFKGFTVKGLQSHKSWAFSIILYSFIVLAYIFPKLDTLKIPVIFYFSAILIMVLSAMDFSINHSKNNWIFYGACLFLISDSLIAINKFQITIPFDGLMIMGTYILAQWFITDGYAKYLNN